MKPEERAKVLAALEAITKHFGISRLHESTLADTTVRGQAHEAIAIMRKEPPQISPEDLAVLWESIQYENQVATVDQQVFRFAVALLEKAR